MAKYLTTKVNHKERTKKKMSPRNNMIASLLPEIVI